RAAAVAFDARRAGAVAVAAARLAAHAGPTLRAAAVDVGLVEVTHRVRAARGDAEATHTAPARTILHAGAGAAEPAAHAGAAAVAARLVAVAHAVGAARRETDPTDADTGLAVRRDLAA